jgi:Putative citrate transport
MTVFTLNRTAIRDLGISSRSAPGDMSVFSPGRIVLASLFASVIMTATPAMAGEALDGARLPWPLALPFAGMLLSIALGPLAVKEWWHIHYAKAAGFWAILALGGLIAVEGLPVAAAGFVHSIVLEYLPFILMLFALFTAAGGISIEGRLDGSAPVNTTILALGTVIASVIGPIVPSLILIRPLIRANRARAFNAHVVVFFIFLVANIGGVLTPVGDPPCSLASLKGSISFGPRAPCGQRPCSRPVRCLRFSFLSIRILTGVKQGLRLPERGP